MIRRIAFPLAAAAVLLACQSCGAETAVAPRPASGAQPPAAVQPASAERPNVILISWDGLDRAVLKELLEAGKLPNLAELIKAGSLQEIEVRGHDTKTRPSHAEMLTGLSADKTGIHSNADMGSVPVGTTIFERVRSALGPGAAATIMVTGKSYVGTLVPEGARASIDTFDSGSRPASKVGPSALAAIDKHKGGRFLAFFHFLDPDSAGHAEGRDSAEYREAARTCDRWLGATLELLKKEKLDSSTLVYVMADHGFDVGGFQHDHAPDSWLATNDKAVARGGTIADVPATILERFGVDASKLEPALLGRPLTGQAVEAK